MSLISEGSVCLEIGKGSEEGDPEYERRGPGNVAVLLGYWCGPRGRRYLSKDVGT